MWRGAMKRMAAALLICLMTSTALADARTDFLVRILGSSTQFRVRLQAALALGSQKAEPQVLAALSKALGDANPSVRSASASSLARLGDRSVVPALERARRDRDADVRRSVEMALASLSPSSRSVASTASGRAPPSTASTPPSMPTPSGEPAFYVGVGTPGNKAGIAPAELERARQHLVRSVGSVEGVVLAPDGESPSAAKRVLSQRKLAGFYVDGSVTKVELRPDGSVRAEVSVIVGTYPGRAIRAMLSGAATVSGGGASPMAREQAIQGAFTGALRRLPQAMRSSALAQGD